MTSLDVITQELTKWPRTYVRDEHVVVPTFALYPSGSIICAYVHGGPKVVQVSDGGGALEELGRFGDAPRQALDALVRFGRRHGFAVDGRGWITAKPCDAEMTASKVALVAEVSREAASFLVGRFRAQPRYDYRDAVDVELRNKFNDGLTRGARVMGAEKMHKFDYKIELSKGRQLYLDLVVPDSNSINAAVVSHLDLKHRGDERILQSIVYNPDDGWPSSDISLLSMAVAPIRASALPKFLDRLAA